MNNIVSNEDEVLLNNKLDGAGEPILISDMKLDNEYAQLVQDLLEMRS